MINSFPTDALRTISVREVDRQLLSPDWLDGHGPLPYALNPSPPHEPPPDDDGDDDGDDDADDDGDGGDWGPGWGHGDGGDGDVPGSDEHDSLGKPDRDQGARRGVKRSADSMSSSSYAGVSVLEIGYVNDPFAAQSEATPVTGAPEATDTAANSGATQRMF